MCLLCVVRPTKSNPVSNTEMSQRGIGEEIIPHPFADKCRTEPSCVHSCQGQESELPVGICFIVSLRCDGNICINPISTKRT